MDPDMILEVPDTPDRLMQVKDASRNADNSEHIYSLHHNGVGFSSSRISPNDTEELFKRAKLALSISDTPHPSAPHRVGKNGVLTEGKDSMKSVDNHDNLFNMSCFMRQRDAKGNTGKEPTNGVNELLGHHISSELGSSGPTSPVGCCRSGFSVDMSQTEKGVLQDETHVNRKSKGKGKGTQSCNDSQPKSEHIMSSTSHTDITRRPTGRRRLVRNGVISPCNTQSMLQDEQAIAPSATRSCSSLVELDDLDISEESVLSAAGHRNRENRQILHNGNADYRRKIKQNKADNVALPEVPDELNAISNAIGRVGDICNGEYNYSKKGKAIADYNVVNEQRGKIALHSCRTHRRAETDMTVSGGTSGQTSTAEDPYHRSHNRTGKPSSFSFSGSCGVHKTKEMPNRKLGSRSSSRNAFDNSQSTNSPESIPNTEQLISEIDSENRRKISIKGKRKCSSTHDSSVQQSNSDFEDTDILYMGTSQQALNSRSSRSRSRQHSGIVLGPIIEVDELPSPEATCSNPPLGSPEVSYRENARARQVESDEILARRLQEQLYNESPEVRSSDEIDAILALSLQEESVQHTSSASRRSHHNRRERFVARLRSQLASRNARYMSSAGISRLMRDIDLQGLDIDTRLDLFEELELAFDNSNATAFSHIFNVQRDFNENDYEALLALDDNNHQHLGASEIQINSLPQSVLQTDNVEEPCAICLENPSVGETIRHLPCLHKFHKDCIDQWLRLKISCPICKSDIT